MEILKKEQEINIKKPERKINTKYQSIINNCEELEYFEVVKISKTKKNNRNGKEYLIVKLK